MSVTIVRTRKLRPSAVTVPLDELSADDIERWAALAAAAIEPNPFFESAFVLAAAERLGGQDVSLLVVESGEHWTACLPVRRVRVAGVPVALRSWCHAYCFLGTPLLEAGTPEAAALGLVDLALAAPGHRLVLERLRADGEAGAALRAAIEDLGVETVIETSHERALLKRTSDGERRATISSHHRREVNRLGRQLAAHLGGELSVRDEAGEPAAVTAFLELEQSGWKGERGTALASRPAHAAFFEQVCRSFADDHRLELLSLWVGDRRVAMKCNLYAGEGGFCFKIAHDATLRRFSPGVQLERENIRIFDEQRSEAWQDSCADPDNAMINRLWPGRRQTTTTVLARAGLGATASRRGARAVQAMRTRARMRSSTRS